MRRTREHEIVLKSTRTCGMCLEHIVQVKSCTCLHVNFLKVDSYGALPIGLRVFSAKPSNCRLIRGNKKTKFQKLIRK